jgi:hypothetical protein
MITLLLGLVIMNVGGSSRSLASSWQDSYEAGLKAGHLGRWSEARTDFQQADHERRGDDEHSTLFPGSPEEPIRWRNGSPYSPKFLSAYCEYRLAIDSRDPAEQATEFQTSKSEFDNLLQLGEKSRDTLFYLELIDTRLKDTDAIHKLHEELTKRKRRRNWRVDEDLLAPEELSAMQLLELASNKTTGSVAPVAPGMSPTIQAGTITTGTVGQTLNPIIPGEPLGAVPHMGDKYAIVIGEDGSQLGQNAMPFASYDAQVLKDGLVNYGGYDAANVTLIQNATAPQIMEQAKALSLRVPQDAVVLLFFAGPGVSVQGKDYFSAADTTSRFDTETMVAKSSLYDLFFNRGARLFSFYEVNRPIENGVFFGSETPKVGSVSQMEATTPDSEVTTTVANGHMVGLFAQSFIEVLAELKSNRLPIYEFGWQIYNKMRRGNTGNEGGGGHQIPTLPVLNNLASDARF